MQRRTATGKEGPVLMRPAHLSHSARETLNRCAKSYFLRYFTPAPRRPALWSAGGSAVHEVTEAYDRDSVKLGGTPDWDEYTVHRSWQERFVFQLDEARRVDPNEWNWGRSPSEPIEVWNVNGPKFIQSYIDWRKRSPYTIWTTPDGVPAIELNVSGMLPGCPVEIKGYVDRIFHDPVFDRLIDVDLKSGKRPPKNGDQFGTYNALMQVKYGVETALGVPFLNRRGTLGKPYELAAYTPEAVGEVFAQAWAKIQTGEFTADTSDCFICDVASSCAAKGGPLASRYDPDHENYEHPPF
jgi:putative RecB family exonuclease